MVIRQREEWFGDERENNIESEWWKNKDLWKDLNANQKLVIYVKFKNKIKLKKKKRSLSFHTLEDFFLTAYKIYWGTNFTDID